MKLNYIKKNRVQRYIITLGQIVFNHISSANNINDPFTKPLL